MSESTANIRASSENANHLKEQLTKIKLLTNDNYIKDQQIEILKDNIRDLQDRLAKSERGVRSLENIVEKREQEIQELVKTADEVGRQRTNSTQKIDSLGEKLVKSKSDRKTLQELLEKAHIEKEALTSLMEELQAKYCLLEQNLQKTVEKLRNRETQMAGLKEERDKQEHNITELKKTLNNQKTEMEHILKENLKKENKLKKQDQKIKSQSEMKDNFEREKSTVQALKNELDQIRKKNLELNEKISKSSRNNEKGINNLKEIETRIQKADLLNEQLQAEIRDKDRELLIKVDEIAECTRARKEEKFFTELDLHNLISFLDNYTKDSGVCPFRSELGQHLLRIRSMWERLHFRKEDDEKEIESLKKNLRDSEKEIYFLRAQGSVNTNAVQLFAENEIKNGIAEDNKADALLELEQLFFQKEKKFLSQIRSSKEEVEKLKNTLKDQENKLKERDAGAKELMGNFDRLKETNENINRELFEKEQVISNSKSAEESMARIKNLLASVLELLFFTWRRFQILARNQNILKPAALARLRLVEELRNLFEKRCCSLRDSVLRKFKKSANAVIFCKRLLKFHPNKKMKSKMGRLLYGDPLANTLRWAANKIQTFGNKESKLKIKVAIENMINISNSAKTNNELLLKINALFNDLEPSEDQIQVGWGLELAPCFENDDNLLCSIEALNRENKYLSEEFSKVNEKLLSFDQSYTEIQNENLKLLEAERKLRNTIVHLENQMTKDFKSQEKAFYPGPYSGINGKENISCNSKSGNNNSRRYTNSEEKENFDQRSESSSTVDFLQKEIASKQKKIRDLEEMFESSLKQSYDFMAGGPPSFENSQQFIQKIPGRIYSSGMK